MNHIKLCATKQITISCAYLPMHSPHGDEDSFTCSAINVIAHHGCIPLTGTDKNTTKHCKDGVWWCSFCFSGVGNRIYFAKEI